jgi:hypothetical protein
MKSWCQDQVTDCVIERAPSIPGGPELKLTNSGSHSATFILFEF